jgi:hypothetical protein
MRPAAPGPFHAAASLPARLPRAHDCVINGEWRARHLCAAWRCRPDRPLSHLYHHTMPVRNQHVPAGDTPAGHPCLCNPVRLIGVVHACIIRSGGRDALPPRGAGQLGPLKTQKPLYAKMPEKGRQQEAAGLGAPLVPRGAPTCF